MQKYNEFCFENLMNFTGYFNYNRFNFWKCYLQPKQCIWAIYIIFAYYKSILFFIFLVERTTPKKWDFKNTFKKISLKEKVR